MTRLRRYGQRTPERRTISVSLTLDTWAALLLYAEEHNLKPSGAAHHLLRLSLNLNPLDTLD
jgi:hypothetical protein